MSWGMMMRLGLERLGLVTALALLAGSQASAAVISGTGLPSDVITGGAVIDFDSTAAGLYNSLTFGNVTISGVGAPFTVGGDYNGEYNTSGGQALYNDFDYTPMEFRFDFASTVSAFAFNWGAADTNWLLSAFDGAGNLLDSVNPTATWFSNAGDYFGLSASGIAYATLTGLGGGDYVFIDNFTSTSAGGGVSPVPVPAAAPLLLAALGALGLASKRRRKTA